MIKKFTQKHNNTYNLRSKPLSIIEEEQDTMTDNGQTSGLAQNNSIDIFNSLRIPDAIKDLPKFDGNPRLLYEFINNVEEILIHIQNTDTTPQGKIFLRAIRNKVEGEANEILNMYGTQLVWDEIKNNLILHYSDKRTETSLIRDLHRLQQDRKSTEKFYSEVIELQSALINNIRIHESDRKVISSKKELYSEMCLSSFLSGLREPLGSSIRAMRPKSLAEAFSFCIKEQNIFYSRYVPYSGKSSFGDNQQKINYPQNRSYSNNYQRNYQQDQQFLSRNLTQPSEQTIYSAQPQQRNQNSFKQEVNSTQTRRTQQSQNFKDNNSRYSNFRNNGNYQNNRSNSSFPKNRFQESNNVNTFQAVTENSYFQNLDNYSRNVGNEELANIEEPPNFQAFASRNQRDI